MEYKLAKDKNLYLIYGSEVFLRKKAIVCVKDSLNLTMSELNYSVFEEKADLSEVISALNTLPMFDEYRLVLLRDCIFLGNEQEFKKFHEQILNLATTTILLIELAQMDKRKSYIKTLLKLCHAFVCESPKPAELISFCIKTAKSNGLVLSKENAQALTLRFSDMQTIENEILKLSCVCKNEITSGDILKYTSASNDYNIFEMNNLFLSGKPAQALSLYSMVFENEKSPFGIIGIVALKFKNMLKVKMMMDANYSHVQIEKTIGYFNLKEAMPAVNNYTAEELRSAIVKLSELDINLKTGRADMKAGTENLLLSIYKYDR